MDDDEWDLHAVVRSCSAINSNTSATVEEYENENENEDELYKVETGNEETNPNPYTSSGELEEVYKEGCSQRLQQVYVNDDDDDDEQQPQRQSAFHASDSLISIESASKKRKNQQKKMVVELTQEELCNDTWAWRKYGQKPIKGSPFPRNYYKCSTTKACGARKQVEQSPMDPTVFIVSYSGEHIHPRPTHRSPLAGSTRSNKFTTQSPCFPSAADLL